MTGAAKGKDAEPGENPAVRVFKPGATINYVYSVFNARMDTEKRAFLETRVRILREGQEIYASEPVSAPPQSEPDPSRRVRQGTVHLLQNVKPAPLRSGDHRDGHDSRSRTPNRNSNHRFRSAIGERCEFPE